MPPASGRRRRASAPLFLTGVATCTSWWPRETTSPSSSPPREPSAATSWVSRRPIAPFECRESTSSGCATARSPSGGACSIWRACLRSSVLSHPAPELDAARLPILGTVRPAHKRRGFDELSRLVGAGLGVDEFRARSLSSLRRIVTIDAAFYATVDDATMVMTSALSEPPLIDAAFRFLNNEYGVVDVNKFTDVADLAKGVASLDQVTGGDRSS